MSDFRVISGYKKDDVLMESEVLRIRDKNGVVVG